jgi:SnoaL-like domain
VLVSGACVTKTVRPRGVAPAPLRGPAQVEALVRLALLRDAAGDPSADSLYAPDALVVANARRRLAAPRFAGVGAGGRILVTGATVTLEGRFAWALLDYRWVKPTRHEAEAGRVTFVCREGPTGWRIVHAHSSQLLPWER